MKEQSNEPESAAPTSLRSWDSPTLACRAAYIMLVLAPDRDKVEEVRVVTQKREAPALACTAAYMTLISTSYTGLW